MKLSSCSWVAAALYATSSVSAQGQEPAAMTAATPSYEQAPEPTAMIEPTAVLELRQVQQNPDAEASPAPSQAPIATTNWVETSLPGGGTTYVPEAYTQLFSSVPDQWPSPGVGTIGYGTLKQNKRDVEAVQTGSSVLHFAQPAVLVLRTAYVVQPMHRVVVVEIVETITEMILPVMTTAGNATSGYGNATGTGTGFATGTGFPWSTGTAASGYGVSHNTTATPCRYNSASSSCILPLPYHLTHLPDGPWNGHTGSST